MKSQSAWSRARRCPLRRPLQAFATASLEPGAWLVLTPRWRTGPIRSPTATPPKGAFNIDEGKKIVTHHLNFANNPNWVGTDLVRSYQLENNKLVLTAAPSAASGATLRLVWERLPD